MCLLCPLMVVFSVAVKGGEHKHMAHFFRIYFLKVSVSGFHFHNYGIEVEQTRNSLYCPSKGAIQV